MQLNGLLYANNKEPDKTGQSDHRLCYSLSGQYNDAKFQSLASLCNWAVMDV